MTDFSDMVTRVRGALGVNSSYEAVTIPSGIRDTMRKLLRDYNFPKSIVRTEFTPLAVNQQNVTLPSGFKRPLRVQFYDTLEGAWSEPLKRRDGFTKPSTDDASEAYPRYYWLEGLKLWWDLKLDSGYAATTLQLFHQSNLVDATSEAWLLTDFGDCIFTYTVVRMAPEVRKSEVLQAFAPLWQLDQQSLAIYTNELEFAGMDMRWREPVDPPADRYPA